MNEIIIFKIIDVDLTNLIRTVLIVLIVVRKFINKLIY